MQTFKVSNVNCFIKNTYIKAVDNTVTLFEGLRGPCHANDLYCPMPDGVIILSEHIIHKCDLEYVESGLFLRRDNLIYTNNRVNTSLSATAIHLLFQLEQVEIHCNIEGYNTPQGLWLTKMNINVSEYEALMEKDAVIIEPLILADEDYGKYVLDTNIHQVAKDQAASQCHLLQSILNILEHDEDTFHTIHDLNGNPLITYTYNSNLYVPRCTPIYLSLYLSDEHFK